MATEADSKLEQRLKGIPVQPGKEGDKPDGRPQKSSLDQALEAEDDDLSLEVKRTRAAEIVARRNLAIRNMQKQMNGNGDSEESPDGKPRSKKYSVIDGVPVEDPEGEFSTFAQALMMAKASVRWTIIDGRPVEDEEGEYRTFSQALQVASMERVAQDVKKWTIMDDKPFEDPNGEYSSFADAYKVAYLGILKKNAEAELKAAQATALAAKPNQNAEDLIKSLSAEINGLKQQIAQVSNPFEVMRRAKAMKDEFMEAGLISPPAVAGESFAEKIEWEKEKNRVELEKRKLDAEEKYKESVAGTFASIPRLIGNGVSQDILRNIGIGNNPVAANMEQFPCEKCKTMITVAPGTMSVKCPKCGEEYRKGSQPDPMAPAGAP
jgi:hypothetical protein